MEKEIDLTVNKNKIFLQSFLIVLVVFIGIYNIFKINFENTQKFDRKYKIVGNYKKVYYSEKYCLVGFNGSRNSFNYERVDPDIQFTSFEELSNKFICQELFGSDMGNFLAGEDNNIIWDFHVTLRGYHTSIISIFLPATVI